MIPGPVEPIILTVGGGSFAGIFQHQALRRQGIHAPKWLFLWIVGLIAGVVATAVLMISIEGLGLALSWALDVFITGFIIAGVSASISGKALLATFPGRPNPEQATAGT